MSNGGCPRFCKNCSLTCVMWIDEPAEGMKGGCGLFGCFDKNNMVPLFTELRTMFRDQINSLFVYDENQKMFVNIRVSQYVSDEWKKIYKTHISHREMNQIKTWKFRMDNDIFDKMIAENPSNCKYYTEQLLQQWNK